MIQMKNSHITAQSVSLFYTSNTVATRELATNIVSLLPNGHVSLLPFTHSSTQASPTIPLISIVRQSLLSQPLPPAYEQIDIKW
jgi:hypothetical protein